MPPCLNEMREIRPTAPDNLVQGLLALPYALILPLDAGTLHRVEGGEGVYTLIAAVRGNLTVTTREGYTLLNPGQLQILSQMGSCDLQAVSDCLCMAVQLRGTAADQLLGEKLREGEAMFPRGASAVREAVMALSVLEEEKASVSAETASSYAYSMLMTLREARAEEELVFPTLVESAIAIIQAEFPFLDGLDDLAERLEVSKAHLSRCFMKTTGISPGKYITRVKIEYAKLLLRDEDVTISYVAEASGFANANYFAKVFRRETGMTPTEYLESAPRQRSGGVRPRNLPPVW